jgi:integrase/recombinase XerD
MEFVEYLHNQNAPGTVKRYQREIELFFFSLERIETASYQQIMDYLGKLRKEGKKDVKVSLYAIKKYYNYLVQTEKRNDNPAKSIRLRDKKCRDIQLQDLFKPEELELLLERKERYGILKNRNKIIISLLIYQGLTNGEIKALELKDIDLEEGAIYIKATNKSNGRTLKLKSMQIMLFYKYISEPRPILADCTDRARPVSDKLILTKSGTPETGEGISYLLETFKHLFPDRKLNAKTIRQSVLANLLKRGKDLRLVQAFAGHKYPSATEKYRQTGIEELKKQVEKYHPLGNEASAELTVK